MTGSSENHEDAEKTVAEYHRSLVEAKFKQEIERDRSLVLISGGALTVSFAFVSTLIGLGAALKIGWLVGAWLCWGAVLTLTITAYNISIKSYQHLIGALSEGNWEAAHKSPKWATLIEPLNDLVAGLLLLGFLCCGVFTISALSGVANAKAETRTSVSSKKSREEGGQSIQGSAKGAINTSSTTGVPAQKAQSAEMTNAGPVVHPCPAISGSSTAIPTLFQPICVEIIQPRKSAEELAEDVADRQAHEASDRATLATNRSLVAIGWTQAAIFALQLLVFGYQSKQLRKTQKVSPR